MDRKEDKRVTKKITVYGIVQGVGFRPLVYHIAQKHNIYGTVRNIGGIVEIISNSTESNINDFLKELKNSQYGGCEIIEIEIEDIPYEEFNDFRIIKSNAADEISIIPPDLPVCSECEKELYTVNNQRFGNPFISCMHCGPRYTIIEELPYDRCNTTMKDFDMCGFCNDEYTSPESRRFHAQTISCNDCGPYLIFRPMQNSEGKCFTGTGNELQEKEALEAAISIIASGGIVAVKGIGGFHLVCSPFNETAVLNLRNLKGREEKPFAVMFESMASIKKYCIVSDEEEKLLGSKAKPIVLLYIRDDKASEINHNRVSYLENRDNEVINNKISTDIIQNFISKNQEGDLRFANKGSIYCGAFLPYTPLQLLLTGRCGPLIMTSANISNQPIIRDDPVMLSLMSPYLNGVLYNTRRIVRSVDDSVAKVINHKPQIIRRSRGYVPYPIFIRNSKKDIQIFAAGGDLKAAYCLYKKGYAVISQYFGDLEELTVLQEYEKSVTDIKRLLKIAPELAVCDYHPNYHSVGYANKLGIPVLRVQHHHAHVASVMAEHQLNETVIGVALDGTGYGLDGNIWGGEFLICDGASFIRAAHLKYTAILGGDSSMRDARKTADCYLIASGLEDCIRDERNEIIKAAVKNRMNTVLNSSMGRLFDAAASILNIGHENRYEGECAANLEREAVFAQRRLRNLQNDKDSKHSLYKSGDNKEELSFIFTKKNGVIEIDPKPVLKYLCENRDTADAGLLALDFHYAVTDMIVKTCEDLRSDRGINTVILCGGVFQNTILIERTRKFLEDKGFRVYVNEAVPPNDGSISLGQTYIGLMM